MALLTRKKKFISNPFVVIDGEYTFNILFSNEYHDINIEDIILGCIRSFKADLPEEDNQEYVNVGKVIKLYKHVDELSSESIGNYLRCGESTAYKYLQVIKTCNPFLVKHLSSPKTDVVGYKEPRCTPIYVVNRAEFPENPDS